MRQESRLRLRLALLMVAVMALMLWNVGQLLAAGEQLRGAVLSTGGVVSGDGVQLRGMAGAVVAGTTGSSSAELCSGFACAGAESGTPSDPNEPDDPDDPGTKIFMPMIQTNE